MDKETKKRLMQTLNAVPKSEWPRLWAEMICSEWPEELSQKPIEGADDVERFYLVVIARKCGLRACYRYLNTKLDEMAEGVFDDWWRSGLTFDEYFNEPRDKCPEWVRKQCATKDGKRSNHPIMRKLLSSLGTLLSKRIQSGTP